MHVSDSFLNPVVPVSRPGTAEQPVLNLCQAGGILTQTLCLSFVYGEMFPQRCCDVVSQALPTMGHCTTSKELVLDVKKKFKLYNMLAKDFSM